MQLALSLTHSHKHTLVHTHTHTHPNTFSHTHTHMHTHTQSLQSNFSLHIIRLMIPESVIDKGKHAISPPCIYWKDKIGVLCAVSLSLVTWLVPRLFFWFLSFNFKSTVSGTVSIKAGEGICHTAPAAWKESLLLFLCYLQKLLDVFVLCGSSCVYPPLSQASSPLSLCNTHIHIHTHTLMYVLVPLNWCHGTDMHECINTGI